MKEEQQKEILNKAKDFFKAEITLPHISNTQRAAKLSNYNLNPFLLSYLSNFLTGNNSAESIAKALIYPRILGSSITTSFGMRFQKLITVIFEGLGSTTPGIDIEFIDALDGRKKYCQLKSGPNTINFDDRATIFNHFQATINLARTNNLDIGFNDLVVGVLYGDSSELSSHYQKINDQYPVIVGENFWHHLTGNPEFYFNLIDSIGEVALEVDGTEVIQRAIADLAVEIEAKFPEGL